MSSLQNTHRSAAPAPRRETPGHGPTTAEQARRRVLAGLPVTERQYRLAGIPTAVLEGGDGSPMVLLHGPGEFAGNWMQVLPALTSTNHVIAPDLPGHGASGGADVELSEPRVLAWLDELIERTCPSPPVLVGHVLGGAIAARYAARHGQRIARLVLVDTLGLAPFRPAPRFALALVHFMARPNERTYDRLMRQCSADLDAVRAQMGERWKPFAVYNIEHARGPASRAVGRLMRDLGIPPIPAEELQRIAVPTALIWGRQDRANRVRIAEAASARFGWALHVVEDCADDPPRDRPQAFLAALSALQSTTGQGVPS